MKMAGLLPRIIEFSRGKDTVLVDLEYSKIRDFGYCRCIKVEEVKSAINKMSKGRATGPNEISIKYPKMEVE